MDVVAVVVLSSKVIGLDQIEQRCQPGVHGPPLDSCPLRVAGSLAGVTPTQGGLLNLNKMVRQVTGKTPITSYWYYGCHCGLGGRGQPLDATDW